MKILHLCRSLAQLGGVETHLARLVGEQAKCGHFVSVVACEEASDSTNDADPSHIAPGNHVCVASHESREQILDLAASFGPDLVHIHETFRFPLASALAKSYPALKHAHVDFACAAGGRRFFRRSRSACARRLGLSCLWHYYAAPCGPAPNPLEALRGYHLARQGLATWARTACVVANSRYVRQSLVQAGLPGELVRTLHYFVPTAEATTVLSSEQPPWVLYVGRIIPDKGLDDLLQVMARLDKEYRLAVVGDGFSRAYSEALAHELGIADRVEFAGWQEDVERYYERASLLVVPSLWPEPFGIVGIEAMARGLPVVAYRSGGIPEWLDNGVTGTLVEPGDIAGLAGAIDGILSDPEAARRMGQAGQERQRELFSPEPHMKRLEEIYREAIANFKAR